MATDNHRDSTMLFPDPQENFDHSQWQPSADSAVHPSTTPAPSLPAMPAVGDNDSPTTDPAHGRETEHHYADADHDFGDIAPETVPVPYWVAAHVPADRLVMDQPQRRFRRRRTAPAPTPPVDDTTSQLPASPVRPRRRISSTWIVAAGVAAAALIGAVVIVNGRGDAPDTTNSTVVAAPTAVPSASITAPTSAAPAPFCTAASTPDATTTDAAGGRGNAVDVIAAFEHAYYVQRSGAAAHALVSPNAPASAPFNVEANLDAGIATVPAGTTYCLDIDPLRTGSYTLTLTESGPNGPGTQYRQRITTDQVDGRYVIAAIEQA